MKRWDGGMGQPLSKFEWYSDHFFMNAQEAENTVWWTR